MAGEELGELAAAFVADELVVEGDTSRLFEVVVHFNFY